MDSAKPYSPDRTAASALAEGDSAIVVTKAPSE
jgi:hypothetical protein